VTVFLGGCGKGVREGDRVLRGILRRERGFGGWGSRVPEFGCVVRFVG
jgi:hypothetical protein